MSDKPNIEQQFQIRLEPVENNRAATITLPFDVNAAFGSRAIVTVCGTINGSEFRGSVFPLGGGKHYMVVTQAMQAAANAKPGDVVEMTIRRDDVPRVIEAPDDFAAALAANPAAQAAWDKLGYSRKREHVNSIEEAKTDATRQRRIAKAVETLAAGKKQG